MFNYNELFLCISSCTNQTPQLQLTHLRDSLTLSVHVCVSGYLFVSVCLFVCFRLSASLSVSVSLTLRLCPSVCLFICVCLFASLSMSVSLSVSVWLLI